MMKLGLMRLMLAVGGIVLVASCQHAAKDDPPPAATAARSASATDSPSASATAMQPPIQERHYTRFKVTSAKPADVESAMQQGWRLVNCSLAALTYEDHQRCYFEGDDRIANDGGTSPGSSRR